MRDVTVHQERVVDLQNRLIEALSKIRWIEHYLLQVRHDGDGCEIEAWVGFASESASRGTLFRAATLDKCIDMAMAADDAARRPSGSIVE